MVVPGALKVLRGVLLAAVAALVLLSLFESFQETPARHSRTGSEPRRGARSPGSREHLPQQPRPQRQRQHPAQLIAGNDDVEMVEKQARPHINNGRFADQPRGESPEDDQDGDNDEDNAPEYAALPEHVPNPQLLPLRPHQLPPRAIPAAKEAAPAAPSHGGGRSSLVDRLEALRQGHRPGPPSPYAARPLPANPSPQPKGEETHDAHKFKSLEEFYRHLSPDSLAADILQIGGSSTELTYFPANKVNETERIWFFCTDPNYLRCFTRNDHDHVILDLCIDVHKWRQQWMFSEDGRIGNVYEHLGEYCLTGTHTDMVVVAPCRKDRRSQRWRFKPGRGLVHDDSGKCVVANPGYSQVHLAPCNFSSVQWFMKVSNSMQPHPDEWSQWLAAFERWRQSDMDVALPYVARAIARSQDSLNAQAQQDVPARRRAVVFYQPAGFEGILAQVRWWVFAWQQLKLNEADQAFDVLIYGDLPTLSNLTKDFGCQVQSLNPALQPPSPEEPGRCWIFPFIGASEREPNAYDGWLNSIEVLVNEATRSFLARYHSILRSDADTFPSPTMRNFWLDRLHMGRNAGYNNGYSRVKVADAARSAGLQYSNIVNIASTYYGPAGQVLRVADLTVAAARFLRAALFTMGTGCKLPPLLRPPSEKCEWGSGLWEGVMLLYSQEVAVNHLIAMGDSITWFSGAQMDVGSAGIADVCNFKMIHVYHNDDRFSKFHFVVGNYKNLDMSEYRLRTTQDYCTWIALTPNHQGKNSQQPLDRIGGDLSKLCTT